MGSDVIVYYEQMWRVGAKLIGIYPHKRPIRMTIKLLGETIGHLWILIIK